MWIILHSSFQIERMSENLQGLLSVLSFFYHVLLKIIHLRNSYMIVSMPNYSVLKQEN